MFENCYSLYSIGEEKTAKQRKQIHLLLLSPFWRDPCNGENSHLTRVQPQILDIQVQLSLLSPFGGILVMMRTPISQEFNPRSLIYRCNYLFFPLSEGSL